MLALALLALTVTCAAANIAPPPPPPPASPAICTVLPNYAGCEIIVQQQRWQRGLSDGDADADTTCPPYLKAPALVPGNPLPAAWTAAFPAVKAVLDGVLNERSVPAYYATMVYRDEVIWSHGEGVRDKKETPPMPPTMDNIFRIGSITKLWPTILAFQAQETGLVNSLDDPFDAYVPGMQMLHPTTKLLTSFSLRQLASQMAGMPREPPCRFPCANETLATMAVALQKQFMLFPPDTRPSYSNLGFAVLGHGVAENILGMPFDKAAQRFVQDLLGLTSTGVNITAEIKARFAVGYLSTGLEAPLYSLGFIAPAGELYSSNRDLAVLAMELLRGEERFGSDPGLRLFKRHSTMRKMLLPTIMLPQSGTDGFGTPFELLWRHGYVARTKGGNVDGYSSNIGVIPEIQLGFTMTFTGGVNTIDLASTLLDTFLPAFLEGLKSIQSGSVPPPNGTTKYIGSYINPDGLGTILVVENRNQPGALLLNNSPITYMGVENIFAIDDVPVTFPQSCLMLAMQAVYGDMAVFDDDRSDGLLHRLSLPGTLPGYYFYRQ